MSAGDAAWLHMDRPLNRMIVNSVMWFDEPMDWGAVRRLLEQRLVAQFPRFSQRVVELPSLVWWQDLEPFDIEPHLKRTTLPGPGGQQELADYVSSLLHHPLPLDRPLWEVHFVDGFHGSGSAMVVRVHHCVADGLALYRVMTSLTDDTENPAVIAAGEVRRGRSIGSALREIVHLGENLADDLVHPTHLVDLVSDGLAGTRALAHILAMSGDAHTSLRGHVGLTKTVLWTDPVRLAAVRDAAHLVGATVNDVVLTAISGALRTYLLGEDGVAPDVRAIVPVNLRPLDEPVGIELGNKFGLIFLTLPLSIEDGNDRLRETKARADAVKHSAQSVVTLSVLDLMGHTPYAVEQTLVELFASKATMIITNVPGPTRPLFLAGRKLRGTIGWPPESGNVGLGLSIITYDGELVIGLMGDDQLVPYPQTLLDGIATELAATIQRCTFVEETLGEPVS